MTHKKLFHHKIYYLAEFSILAVGFSIMYYYAYDVTLQFLLLTIMLLCYIVIGLIHHALNHYFTTKIVVEYILISALILSAFLFLNSARL